MIITIQFHRISIPQPKHIPPPPKLFPLETISISMSVSQNLFCKVQSLLLSDSTCQWKHLMLVSHCVADFTYYSIDFITCAVIITAKFYSISIPNPQCILPPPQIILFGNHKFFKVCESVSVLQRNSLCPFFQIPHVSESIGCWCLIVWLHLAW